MRFLNPVKISYKNLMASKFRSFLTILGVVIGVAAVIIIMAVGRSAQALIIDQIQGIGTNLIAVLPGASNEDGPPASILGISITTLTYDDLQALRSGRRIPEIEDGAGYVSGSIAVKHRNESVNASLTGTTASYLDVEDAEIEKGRFFNESEEAGLSRVAVLGNQLAEDIFGEKDPLNQKIEINDLNFQVVGVLEERGSAAFGVQSQDGAVFIPLKTAQKSVLGINHLAFIRLKVKSPELIESAKANIAITLRDRHNIKDPVNDDFSVRDQASALEIVTTVTNALRYFLLAIGSISLIVGGVGIMNIMLIAVTQRIREVGLRKAVGAKNQDILYQFIIESATVSGVGGVIGIIFGIFVSFLIAIIAQVFGYEWPLLISPLSILIAVAISIGIGVIFGSYPARKASKVSPMEALRYE
jgi:putative ABC transport system permease protein